MRRIGVVGFGAIGRHHARNLASLPGVTFAGVADSSESARADAAGHGYETFGSLAELLNTEPDGVVLSVPTSAHYEMAMTCLDAKVAVLIEKPIASDVASGERIIAAAAAAKLPLMIGYVERYNPAIVALREFIASGRLGRILSITARRVGVMPARIQDANVLVDIGVHDLDVVAFLLNRELRLKSALGGRAILEDRIDYAALALDADGVAVHLETNWITPVKIRELFVTGERGSCHLDYVTQVARFAAARDFAVTEDFAGVVDQYVAGEFQALNVDKEEPLRRELRTFVDGLDGAPLPDPSIALVSLRIAVEATEMIEASRTRQPQAVTR